MVATRCAHLEPHMTCFGIAGVGCRETIGTGHFPQVEQGTRISGGALASSIPIHHPRQFRPIVAHIETISPPRNSSCPFPALTRITWTASPYWPSILDTSPEARLHPRPSLVPGQDSNAFRREYCYKEDVRPHASPSAPIFSALHNHT